MLSESELKKGEQLRLWLRLALVLGFAVFAALIPLLLQCRGWIAGLLWALELLFPIFFLSYLSVRCTEYYAPLLEKNLAREFYDFHPCARDGFSLNRVGRAGLTKAGNRMSCKDAFHGSCRGVAFTWADLEYEAYYPFLLRGGLRLTRFRGLWLEFPNRPVTFPHSLVVLAKGRQSDGFCGGRRVEEFNTWNENFSQSFRAFSSNEKWGKDFLDDELRRRLLLLQSKAPGKIMISFSRREIHLACAFRAKSSTVPLFRDIQDYFADYRKERVDFIRAAVDALWFSDDL